MRNFEEQLHCLYQRNYNVSVPIAMEKTNHLKHNTNEMTRKILVKREKKSQKSEEINL